MKIREQRGSLDASMATVKKIEPTLEAVAEHVTRVWSPFATPVTPEMIRVSRYTKDERIGWDTHIVVVDGLGVFGFTDGPLRTLEKVTIEGEEEKESVSPTYSVLGA